MAKIIQCDYCNKQFRNAAESRFQALVLENAREDAETVNTYRHLCEGCVTRIKRVLKEDEHKASKTQSGSN